MAYLTSDNTPFPVAREALYPSGTTGTIPSGNTSTGFSISLGSLELSGSTSLFDAQTATVVIVNTGTAQTINAATLTFSDSIGSQTPAISYALSGVSIASGASTPFLVSLTGGILKNASVSITFASAPVAGSVTIQATLQSGSASSGGGGGGSSDVAIHDNGTPSYHLKVNSDGSINTSGGVVSSVALNDNTTPSQHATVDSSGNLHVTDAKVPATGQATMVNSLPVVIASNQTAIPISGTITASNASIGTDGSAIPTSSTLIGASDGTNLQQLLVESASNRNLRTGIYSGTNEATVTGANALKVDGSAVTQPVSIAATIAENMTQVGGAAISATNGLPASAYNGTALQVLQSDASGNLKIAHGGATQVSDTVGGIVSAVETSTDGVPQAGIPAGAQQLASPFSTTIAASISTGAQTVTPAVMSGTNRGAAWSIQVGSLLTIDTGSNKEVVKVTTVASTTFTATFAKSHTGPGIIVVGEVLNQARDATTDPTTGAGMSASGTYLYNTQLNSAAGGWEAERSASGENDNASGAGTAVAAEYHWTGQGYDRARNVLGKGLGSGTVSSGGTNGSTSVTMSAAPTGLQPGSPVMLFHGSTQEMIYTTNAYVAGANPVLLQTAIGAGTHTSAQWDIFAMTGPGLNGMLPHGIPIEQGTIYNAPDGMYYQEVSAGTVTNVAGSSLPLEAVGVYNGSAFDALKGTVATGAANVGIINGAASPVPVAGINPSSAVAALQTDANGNLLVTATNATYEYNSGGPVPSSTAIPSQLGLDRVRNLQSRGVASGTITSTNAADSALAFSVAPLTLLGGSPIFLSGGGNPIEVVYASDSFVPGTGVTSVTLKNNVRYASHTTATWSIYVAQGPQATAFLPDGIGLRATALYDPNATAPSQYETAQGDGGAMRVSLYGKTTTLADTPLQIDGSGNLKVTTTGGVAATVSIADPTTPSQKVAVNASGAMSINVAQQNGVALPSAQFMSADGVTASNVPEHGVGLYNGTTVDRWQGTAGAGRVALWGRQTSSADTEIKADSSGNLQIKVSAFSAALPSGNNATGFMSASGTSTLTAVAGSTTTTVVLASNASRRGMSFYNDSSSDAYVAFAATASTSLFTAKVPPNALYEMPLPIYSGAISALWDTATGNARITELS